MSPRPNPTQTKGTDALAWQREGQQWMRPGYVFTQELFEMIMRDPFGSHMARVAVATWLEELREQLERRAVVSVEEAEAAERFWEDKGPRPRFVIAAAAGGYLTTEERATFAAAAAERIAREPKELPGEPGRYVEARGRFALPGSEGSSTDRR